MLECSRTHHPDRMRAASTVLTLSFAAGLFASTDIQAIGFGPVATASQLGQRLDFAVLVRLEPDEALDRSCVSAQVLAGDNLLPPAQVGVTVEGSPGSTDAAVRVTTRTAIDEPVLTIGVTVGCSSPTTRSFTAFLDPPGIGMAQAAPMADLALPVPQSGERQVAPLAAQMPAVHRRPLPRRREASADRSPSRRAESAGATLRRTLAAMAVTRPGAASAKGGRGPLRAIVAAAAAPASSARRLAAAAIKPASTARLQLEAPAPMAVPVVAAASAASHDGRAAAVVPTALVATASGPFAGVAVPTAATPAPSVAAFTDPPTEALLYERRRVQSLEDGLSRMQADAAATRETIAGLQSRLQRAETGRESGSLVVALAVASTLLALLLGATLWRRARSPAAPQWWRVAGAASVFGRTSVLADPDPSRMEDSLATVSNGASSTGDMSESRASATSRSAPGSRPVLIPVESATSGGRVDVLAPPKLAVTSPPGSRPAVGGSSSNGSSLPVLRIGKAAPDSSSSVEELIDLEQQAEFFVVLGQDDAAIDLLSQHLEDEDPASPLPYLKLLEIHRRRDDRAGYEAIRTRFNRDFNAYAPAWDADLQEGRSLEQYPDVLAQLQSHWRTPSGAIEMLTASLFGRGSSGTPFDLPAYRELLSLYSIARDRAQGGADDAGTPASVDLLLPLDNDRDGGQVAPATATATAVLPARVNGRFVTATSASTGTVDFDVSVAAAPVRQQASGGAVGRKTSATAAVAPVAANQESLETVPSALRRSAGHPDESAFVDLELEPVEVGEPVIVR